MVAGLGGLVAAAVIALVVLNAPAGMVAGSGGLGALGVKNSLGGSLGVKLVIQVHHADGSTQTYVKEGDLVLLNFARMLVKATMGSSDPDGDDDLINVNNVAITGTFTLGNGPGQIWLGNSTSPSVNLTDHTFYAPIKFDIQDADIIINGNNMTVDIFGSYTVDTAFNVTEVGLTSQTYSYAYTLIFHDVLATPIHLNAGDGITVHYYIYIINP